MDFILELPESGGYDSIMAAIDSAKRSHFVETVTTVTAAGAVNLYLRNIWKLHGLPLPTTRLSGDVGTRHRRRNS